MQGKGDKRGTHKRAGCIFLRRGCHVPTDQKQLPLTEDDEKVLLTWLYFNMDEDRWIPAASLLLARQRAIFPIFPLPGRCSWCPHFINPFLSLAPLHDPALGEQRESTGHLPCDSWPNLAQGAVAKALGFKWCRSTCGRANSPAGKTSLELPGCDGETPAKVSRAPLVGTRLWSHP